MKGQRCLTYAYPWGEGNVREFKDAVEYLCVISNESDVIRLEHLSDRFTGSTPIVGLSVSEGTLQKNESSQMDEIYSVGLETYLTEVEKTVLSQLYQNHDGNVNELSEKIRVSRPTLYRKLKKHEVL